MGTPAVPHKLTSVTLRQQGIGRQQLSDSEASDDVFTRYWAQALWRDNPQAEHLLVVPRA